MNATNFFEKAVLDTFRGVSLSGFSTVYIALYLTNPTETGAAGQEISYTGYERKAVTFSVPAPQSGGIGVKNVEQINFPKSDRDAGTIQYAALHDSKVGGNMLAYVQLTEGQEIRTDEAPVLLPGEVIFFVTGNFTDKYKTKMLNVLRGQSISGFSPHMALFNGHPEQGGAELSGLNYARAPLQFSAPTETDSGQSEVYNSVGVNFNRPTTTWGMWSYSVIYDAATSGNPVMAIMKSPTKEIKRSCMPVIEEGAVKVGLH